MSAFLLLGLTNSKVTSMLLTFEGVASFLKGHVTPEIIQTIFVSKIETFSVT